MLCLIKISCIFKNSYQYKNKCKISDNVFCEFHKTLKILISFRDTWPDRDVTVSIFSHAVGVKTSVISFKKT